MSIGGVFGYRGGGGSGGTAKFYASLTGAGETTTPGALTQRGAFTVYMTKATTFLVEINTTITTAHLQALYIDRQGPATHPRAVLQTQTFLFNPGRYGYHGTGTSKFDVSCGVISLQAPTVNIGETFLSSTIKIAATTTHVIVSKLSITIDSNFGRGIPGVRIAAGRVLLTSYSTGVVEVTAGTFLSNGSTTHLTNHFLGFFAGSTPTTKKHVTGSRSSGAALVSLLTALTGYGLIHNTTTT